CFEASGLLISLPPGVFSQATAPHMLPLHWATRMLATPSATRQSPVGSAAKAGAALAARIAEKTSTRALDLGQCNMVETYAYLADLKPGVKTPHWAFSVDDMAINRRM